MITFIQTLILKTLSEGRELGGTYPDGRIMVAAGGNCLLSVDGTMRYLETSAS